MKPDATCITCGCNDSRACAGGCGWLWVDREERKGLCSNCAPCIASEDVVRDQMGQYWHSALESLPADTSYASLVDAAGLECHLVYFEEAPSDVQTRYENEWTGDLSYWGLQPPEGAGWFLLAVCDTEMGPVQSWVRPTPHASRDAA